MSLDGESQGRTLEREPSIVLKIDGILVPSYFSSRNSLSRRSFSVRGCSMKITEGVRKYAAEHGMPEEQALQSGMEQKAKDFANAGAELYSSV
jgi:hypothetical protein